MTDIPYLSTNPVYYRLSGKISAKAILIGLPLCMLIGAITGVIAGMLEFLGHIQTSTHLLVIGECIVVAGTGGIVGFSTAHLLNAFNSRSKIFNIGCAILSAFTALYFAWAGWLCHFAIYSHHFRFPLIYLNPLRIVYLVFTLYQHGAYTLLHEKVEGPLILFFWIAEAAVIVGLAVKVAAARSSKNVYCEHCDRWGTCRTILEFRDENIPELQSALLAGNFDPLSSVTPRDLSEDRWCCLLFEGCPSCDNTQSLTLQRTRFLRDANGRTKIKNTPLLHRLLLTPEQTAKIALLAASIPPSNES